MYPHHLHKSDRPCPVTGVKAGFPQRVEVILLHEELRHDIEADLTAIERQRKLETPILASDGKDDYRLARNIDTAVNKVVKRCTAYLMLPSPFVHRISTNHVYKWEEKSLYLHFPENWPPHLADNLRDAVHLYIVKFVELAFLTVALPDDKYLPILQEQVNDAYDDINAALNDRLGSSITHVTFLG